MLMFAKSHNTTKVPTNTSRATIASDPLVHRLPHNQKLRAATNVLHRSARASILPM